MPTQEQVKNLFNYNSKMGTITWTSGKFTGKEAGWISNAGYRKVCIFGRDYQAHRIVWLYHNGYFPENGLDHINRNKSDNRIENLREATQSCNMINTGVRADNKTGVKGVYYNKMQERWHPRITLSGKKHHLGFYKNFHNAVLARLAGEQCLNWEKCGFLSSAEKYAIKNNLVRNG